MAFDDLDRIDAGPDRPSAALLPLYLYDTRNDVTLVPSAPLDQRERGVRGERRRDSWPLTTSIRIPRVRSILRYRRFIPRVVCEFPGLTIH